MIKGFGSGKEVFQGIDKGLCDAAIIDDVAWQVALGGDFSLAEDGDIYANHPAGPERYHCDTKLMLPTAVYAIDIALPVRSDLQRLLSWIITVSKDVGEWNEADLSARKRFIKKSTCTAEARMTPNDLRLKFETGAGVVFFSVALTTLGLLINMCWRCSPGERRRRRDWRRQRTAYRDACTSLGITAEMLEQPKVTRAPGDQRPKRRKEMASEGGGAPSPTIFVPKRAVVEPSCGSTAISAEAI